MSFFENLSVSSDYFYILMIDLAVAFVIMLSLKYISAAFSGVQATDELAEKDNPAFGIALAGSIFGVILMLTGIMSGAPAVNYVAEAVDVALYGLAGLALMIATRFIFDRFMTKDHSIKELIHQGNIAASVTDAGNVIATAIIVRAVMIWVDAEGVAGLIHVLLGYVFSQFLLSLVTCALMLRYKKRNGHALFDGITNGNLALAYRFVGTRIGIALAITGASGLVAFDAETAQYKLYALWAVVAIFWIFVIGALVRIADFVILFKVKVHDEIDQQSNVAIGVLQSIFVISVGLMIAVLTS